MFLDWEHLGNVKRQGIHQQGSRIGNSSAMSPERVYVGNVLRLGIAQQCNRTRYASAMF